MRETPEGAMATEIYLNAILGGGGSDLYFSLLFSFNSRSTRLHTLSGLNTQYQRAGKTKYYPKRQSPAQKTCQVMSISGQSTNPPGHDLPVGPRLLTHHRSVLISCLTYDLRHSLQVPAIQALSKARLILHSLSEAGYPMLIPAD